MKKTSIEKLAGCALLLSVCMLITACSNNNTAYIINDPDADEEASAVEVIPGEEQGEAALPPADAKKPGESLPMPEAVNTFNWEYFDMQDTGSDLFFSPLSIESALAMTLAGAKGGTYDELASVLHISDPDAFMESCRLLAKGYEGSTARLTVANSMWIDESFEKENGIDPSFVSKLEEKMDAGVFTADFRNRPDKASAEITKWVKKNTDNLIPDYQSSSDSSTVLDLINAIYFFGQWQNKFDAADTFEMDFRTRDKTRTVNMMNMHDGHFRYFTGKGFKGIELPYGDGQAVMDIILSEDEEDLSAPDGFKKLSVKDREEFLSKLADAGESKISVLRLPKFTMDLTSEELKETLKAMGAVTAFVPEGADLSGIAKDLYISDISHRAKIEVDEEGSRAAAVTEVTMAVTSAFAEDEERIEFVCDRPFVFVIRDSASKTILFTGVVNTP